MQASVIRIGLDNIRRVSKEVVYVSMKELHYSVLKFIVFFIDRISSVNWVIKERKSKSYESDVTKKHYGTVFTAKRVSFLKLVGHFFKKKSIPVKLR